MSSEEQKPNLVKVDINVQEFKEIIKDITENSSVVSLKEHLSLIHISEPTRP